MGTFYFIIVVLIFYYLVDMRNRQPIKKKRRRNAASFKTIAPKLLTITRGVFFVVKKIKEFSPNILIDSFDIEYININKHDKTNYI